MVHHCQPSSECGRISQVQSCPDLADAWQLTGHGMFTTKESAIVYPEEEAID